MYKKPPLFVSMLMIALVAGTVVWVNAGQLNPPPGPVLPTMHTLDEIYAAVTAVAPCPACSWNYKYSGAGGALQEVEVLAPGTSGILHSIHFRGTIGISDGPFSDPTRIGVFVAPEPNYLGNGSAVLDVPFSNGIRIRNEYGSNPQNTGVTLIYRLNP